MWTEVTADRVWGIPEQRAWLLDESRQLRVLQSCNSPVISLRPVFVMRVAREYVVSGRVQGVGFRYFTRRRRRARAARLGAEPAGRPRRAIAPKATPTRSSDSSARCATDRRAHASSSVETVDAALPTGTRYRLHHQHDPWTISKTSIRNVPDFPKAGILFYDITTLLQDAARVPRRDRQPRAAVRRSGHRRGRRHREPRLHLRRRGRRPHRRRVRPGAQAGQAAVEDRAARPTRSSTAPTRSRCTRTPSTSGQRVLIVDDLLATGGTARATTDLVKRLGGHVHALAFLIELAALNGRAEAGRRADPSRVLTVLMRHRRRADRRGRARLGARDRCCARGRRAADAAARSRQR